MAARPRLHTAVPAGEREEEEKWKKRKKKGE
jgi:hypothetical protein